jgi:diguanylate cyclase (GGDEF)-like protein/hemerythrin-like metal-binding protein
MVNFLPGKPSSLPEKIFPAIVETAPVAMAVIQDGRCVYGNRAFAALRGCQGQSCGRTCGATEFLAGPLGLDWKALSEQVFSGHNVRKHLTFLTMRGHSEEVEVALQSLPGEGGVLLTVCETGEEARVRRLVDHLAFHDSLTELPNRALLFDRLSQALARLRREEGCFVLMLMDLDGFKQVNDSWGHAMGDELLCVVSQRLLSCVRESDTVARLGGDEFAIVLHGIGGEAEAAFMARKVLRRLAEPLQLGEAHLDVGASIGISLCPRHGLSLDALLSHADRAMYQAKQEGKCRAVISDGQSEKSVMPVRMPWLNGIELGHEVMDAQHKSIADAVNAIIEAMANGREAAILDHGLARLEGLVRAHFAHEEALMAEARLACAEKHTASHQRLLAALPSLKIQIGKGSFSTTVQFLRKWLLDHIRSDDRELVEALRNHGKNVDKVDWTSSLPLILTPRKCDS